MKVSRLNAVEQYIIQHGTATIDELCERFSVSKNTIRRDLAELEARGHISKVSGGVTAVGISDIVPMPVRTTQNPKGKQLIGKLASELVSDGDTIFIDSGSTTVKLIRYIAQKKKITLITHSLSALIEAAKYEGINIISLGGIYSNPTNSFVGISTLESLSGLKIHKAFMAATGVSIETGMTNTTFLEAEIKRGIVSRSNSIILMADSTKINREAVITFCKLENLSYFITDERPAQEYIDFCRERNITLLYEE